MRRPRDWRDQMGWHCHREGRSGTGRNHVCARYTAPVVCCNATGNLLTPGPLTRGLKMGDMRAMNTAPVSAPVKASARAKAPDGDRPSFEPATLCATGLVLSRGGDPLVRNLDVSLIEGEAILLTGRNGAGKTTLLRALAGFVQPDAGRVEINGQPVAIMAPDVLGWLGHTDGLKPAETVRQSLEFWTRLHNVNRKSIIAVLRALEMDRWVDRPTGRLSRGQQRRVALARVILSNRPIWFLDEPAGPLDGHGRELLAAQVAVHRSRGGSVIAATHQLLDWPDARSLDLGSVQ